VNIHEAKTQLSNLLAQVEAGEEIVIAKAGKPIARLVPFSGTTRMRILGSERGKVEISKDFDAPLPQEILDLFYK
jgi:prevent-host-death family protein